jgi:hypothetical protein
MKLADPGLTRLHRRPNLSGDNRFSESQGKTTTRRPEFPDGCGAREEPNRWQCQIDFSTLSPAGAATHQLTRRTAWDQRRSYVRTKMVVLFSLLTLLTAGFVYGQSRVVKANIPFAFNVEGKTLPAGQYEFLPDTNGATMRILGAGKGSSVLAMIQTRMAAEIHTTPNDAHIVFDKVGDVYTLSEVWVPGVDGFMLHLTKGKHEHKVVDVSK